jgi:HK97 family phage prohead protease
MDELVRKEASVPFADMDDSTGLLIGYANIYSVKDLVGDISNPTSFVKTVSERKAKIKIYKNHDNNLLVGVPKELDPYNPTGLHLTAKMLMDTALGRDTYHESKFLVENGFESGFSIGGYVTKRNPKNKAEVMEYRLDEVSVLTKEQANQGSMVQIVKSIQDQDDLTQEAFWSIITKAYDNRKFSDGVLISLETFLNKSLDNNQPGEDNLDTTGKSEPTSIIKSIYSQFI